MTRLALSAFLAAALASAALAACGGDDSPEPVSKSELAERADAACVAEQKAFAEIQSEAPTGATGAAEQSDDLADALGDELDELNEMEAPAAQRQAYGRYVAEIEKAKEQLEDGADAADDQDSRGYGKLQSDLAAGKIERRRLAAELGFRKCSPLTAPAA